MIMIWTGTHGAFVVETFFCKTVECVIATHKAFCIYFMLHWNDAVLG